MNHTTRKMSPVKFGALALVLTLAATVGLLGCDDGDPIGADGLVGPAKSPVDNQPPETYLTLNLPDGQLPDTSRSAKTLSWWGEDIDGRVTGYEYRWGKAVIDTSTGEITDTLWYSEEWQFLDETQSVWSKTSNETVDFVLPIRSVSATFTVQVRAIDNDGDVDPEPASISFPIINSRPSISFRAGSNPVLSDLDADTAYTFPVRSFVWDASDPDGNESIESILYALDPQPGDTNWQQLPGTESSLTLTEIEPGQHRFFVKAVDVAGFESSPISWPDTSGANPGDAFRDPAVWMVKQPAPGGFLIVDDYKLEGGNQTTDFYAGILDDLYNGGDNGRGDVYSVWELKTLPYTTTDVTKTLLLFDNVIWYSYLGTPQLVDAFPAMYTFINTPGKRMLLSTRDVDPGDDIDEGMLLDLADGIEQISRRLMDSDADPLILEPVDDASLEPIRFTGVIPTSTFQLLPTAAAEVIYQLDPSTQETPQYEGTPVVGIRRPNKSYTLISLPLHFAADPAPVATLIQTTFEE